MMIQILHPLVVGAGLGIRLVRQTNNAYTKPALTLASPFLKGM
jgi:hypothetical protein